MVCLNLFIVVVEAPFVKVLISGRDPREIRTVFDLPCRVTDRPFPAARDRDGRWIGGSAGRWIEEPAEAVVEHGVSGFTLFADDALPQRVGQEIVPAVREVTAPSLDSPPGADPTVGDTSTEEH